MRLGSKIKKNSYAHVMFLGKEQSATEVSCVYILVFARVYFSISLRPPNFLGGPDRTQPGQLPAVLAALAPSTELCVPSCLGFVRFFFLTMYFDYRVTQLFKSTSIQAAECREAGPSLQIDRQSVVSLSENRNGFLLFAVVE